MNKQWFQKNWLTALLGLVLVIVIAVRFYGNPKSVRFDNLSLESLEGEQVNMDQFAGKPVVLHFWATWCGPCRAEMPSLLSAYEEFGEELSFVMVSDEKIRTLKAFEKQTGQDLPIYHKPSTIKLKGIFSIPQTYLIDSKGNVVQSFEGAVNWDNKEVKRMLGELK